jgi:hypothetical protein
VDDAAIAVDRDLEASGPGDRIHGGLLDGAVAGADGSEAEGLVRILEVVVRDDVDGLGAGDDGESEDAQDEGKEHGAAWMPR